jgi:hypothetical protein
VFYRSIHAQSPSRLLAIGGTPFLFAITDYYIGIDWHDGVINIRRAMRCLNHIGKLAPGQIAGI